MGSVAAWKSGKFTVFGFLNNMYFLEYKAPFLRTLRSNSSLYLSYGSLKWASIRIWACGIARTSYPVASNFWNGSFPHFPIIVIVPAEDS